MVKQVKLNSAAISILDKQAENSYSNKVLALEDEVTILKKQVTYLKQEVKVLEIGSKLLLETQTIPDLIITPKKGNHELKDYLTRLEIESLVEKKIDDAKRGY